MHHKLLDEFFISEIKNYSKNIYINNLLLIIIFVKLVQWGNNLPKQGMRHLKFIF
jgi:hypothetical protein